MLSDLHKEYEKTKITEMIKFIILRSPTVCNFHIFVPSLFVVLVLNRDCKSVILTSPILSQIIQTVFAIQASKNRKLLDECVFSLLCEER